VEDVTDGIKLQYEKLANDWRHFNTIVWGIPTVAVAIMASIVIAAYGVGVEGWPRIASLSLGSLLLFALTIETVKKRLHMNAMSLLLKTLQEDGLKLAKEHRFPVGISVGDSDDIKKYFDVWEQKQAQKSPEEREKVPDSDDVLFQFFKQVYARKVLTWVVFIAGIVVALLADLEFVLLYYKPYEWYAIMIGIVAPLIIFGVLLFKRKKVKTPKESITSSRKA
jgi:hypothetical protein